MVEFISYWAANEDFIRYILIATFSWFIYVFVGTEWYYNPSRRLYPIFGLVLVVFTWMIWATQH